MDPSRMALSGVHLDGTAALASRNEMAHLGAIAGGMRSLGATVPARDGARIGTCRLTIAVPDEADRGTGPRRRRPRSLATAPRPQPHRRRPRGHRHRRVDP